MVAKISNMMTCLLPPVVTVATLRDALKQAALVNDDAETAWVPVEHRPKGRVLIDTTEEYDLRECSDFYLKPVSPWNVRWPRL